MYRSTAPHERMEVDVCLRWASIKERIFHSAMHTSLNAPQVHRIQPSLSQWQESLNLFPSLHSLIKCLPQHLLHTSFASPLALIRLIISTHHRTLHPSPGQSIPRTTLVKFHTSGWKTLHTRLTPLSSISSLILLQMESCMSRVVEWMSLRVDGMTFRVYRSSLHTRKAGLRIRALHSFQAHTRQRQKVSLSHPPLPSISLGTLVEALQGSRSLIWVAVQRGCLLFLDQKWHSHRSTLLFCRWMSPYSLFRMGASP